MEEDIKIEGEESGCDSPDCPECRRRAEQLKREEERNFAVLVALVPVMVFTFIGTAGLF
jgi:hypothetical protein